MEQLQAACGTSVVGKGRAQQGAAAGGWTNWLRRGWAAFGLALTLALTLLAALVPGAARAQTPTTTALTSAANPSGYSQQVTLTAVVTGSTPTGTISFKSGTSTLAVVAMSSGQASYLTSSSLAMGSYALTAVYSGDTNNLTSTSSTVTQVVNKYTTTTSLTASANPSVAGERVTLTATISGASTATATGLVSFKNGTTILGTTAASGGVAKFGLSSLAAGSHSLTAVYVGDTYNTASTSATLTQSVTANTATLVLTVPSAAQQGQSVTLMAKLSGSYVATGVVTFTDSASILGTATMTAGAATFSTNSLALGSHTLGASYAGDANNAAATASTVSMTVLTRSDMTWQYGYDGDGRVNTLLDPNALATYVYYDSLGRPIQIQQPPNTGSMSPTVIDLGFDLQDSLTSVTDPRLLTTTYTVKGLGDLAAQSSPDSATTTFTFDAKGNVLTQVDARSKTTTFAYDTLDRLTSISYPTGTATTFEYDGGSSPTAATKGELTKITDESGQTTYGYDALGRMTTKTVVVGSKTFTVGYGWGDSGSALDKLTSITYPGGSRVNYGYDSYGFVNAVTVNPVNSNGSGQSGSSQSLLGSVTYTAQTGISGWLWSDGKARTIGYDAYGQVSSYALGDPNGSGTAAGWLRTLTRDGAGRITGYTHTNNGNAVSSLAQSFGYDSLNRLTAQTQSATSIGYTYDATGNRSAKTVGGSTYTNTVASTSNRLTQVQDALGTRSLSYDAAGNIVGDGNFTFTYSDRGRLASAITSSGTVTYTYNGLGQRARKTGPTPLVGTGASYFVYDEAGQLLGEYDANGYPLYETVYLQDLPVGVMKQTGSGGNNDLTTTLYNVHADQIATPRVITKQDHTIVWRWDTAEAFGATAPDQNPSSLGAFVFNQRFPGQTFDAETGLFQNWNRDYDASIGRYRQSDPIGLLGGINTYSYVTANPITFFDRRGLQASGGDRPYTPSPVVPNPSASAQAELVRLLDKLFCPVEPDCWDLQQKMEEVAGELRQRHVSMTADTSNLFCTRPIGRFSWLGHQLKIHDKRRELQKLIDQAQKKGCPVNAEYFKLVSLDPPTCPAR
jgi:RHS repeat-associated protein